MALKLTIVENLEFMADIYGADKKKIRSMI